MNVVKKIDDLDRYRATGIILNIKPTKVENEDNLYYIRIFSTDLYSKSDNFEGWIPDWTYKIQIRFIIIYFRFHLQPKNCTLFFIIIFFYSHLFKKSILYCL